LGKCQFEVSGWGIMFICGIVPGCAGLKADMRLHRPVTTDLTTTVVIAINR